MNLEDFSNKAVTLEKVAFSNLTLDEAASLVVRWGFPTPETGMTLIAGRRGDTDNGIDWAADRLREYVVNLVESVVTDAIATLQESEELTEDEREKAVNALRTHFGMAVS
jgi:hypothetical protein